MRERGTYGTWDKLRINEKMEGEVSLGFREPVVGWMKTASMR